MAPADTLFGASALERRRNQQLQALEQVEREAEQALQASTLLSDEELEKIHLLGTDLHALWEAPTTSNRDRKRLLRCLIDEVQLRTEEVHPALRIVWKCGAVTEREVVRGKPGSGRRTSEDTVELVRKLALESDDAQIARVLNKQGRRSGLGNPFTQQSVASPRGKHGIPKCPAELCASSCANSWSGNRLIRFALSAARELGG